MPAFGGSANIASRSAILPVALLVGGAWYDNFGVVEVDVAGAARDEKPFFVVVVVGFDELESGVFLIVFDRRPWRDMPMEIRLKMRSMSGATGSLSLFGFAIVAGWWM